MGIKLIKKSNEAAGSDPVGNYICTRSFTHGNMGKVCTKGKQYSVTDVLPDGGVVVNGWHVSPEFLKSHFKKVEGYSMGIKLIKKTNEAERKKFDFSITDEDAQKFDFINLNSRLQKFRGWLEDLQVRVNAPTPTIAWSARGSSGFCYRIANDANGRDEVDVEIRCGTNPEEYPEFNGSIYAGGRIFKIRGIGDLTDKLIDDIVAAVKAIA